MFLIMHMHSKTESRRHSSFLNVYTVTVYPSDKRPHVFSPAHTKETHYGGTCTFKDEKFCLKNVNL